jgi:sucrose-phosphate synthase
MSDLPGMKLQESSSQGPYKISFDVDPETMPSIEKLRRLLRESRLQVNIVLSHGAYLDVLPVRASKGMALRYFATRWGIPLDRCLVAGDSGNDEEMLTGNTLGVVVGNHDPELEKLRGDPWIYFAEGHYAKAIIEAIKHYDFFGEIKHPAVEAAYD